MAAYNVVFSCLWGWHTETVANVGIFVLFPPWARPSECQVEPSTAWLLEQKRGQKQAQWLEHSSSWMYRLVGAQEEPLAAEGRSGKT